MTLDPHYQRTLDYLYSFVDYSLTRSTRYSPEQFDLGRMRDCSSHTWAAQRQREEIYRTFLEIATAAFKMEDFTVNDHLIDHYFGMSTYSHRTLFRDEQGRILDVIQKKSLKNVEAVSQQIYESNAPFLRFLKELGSSPPKILLTVAEFFLNVSLRQQTSKRKSSRWSSLEPYWKKQKG